MKNTATPTQKARHITSIYKSLGYDLKKAIDVVAWHTMTDSEQIEVENLVRIFWINGLPENRC